MPLLCTDGMSFFQLEEMCWSGRGGLPRFDFDFDFDMLLCTEPRAEVCRVVSVTVSVSTEAVQARDGRREEDEEHGT